MNGITFVYTLALILVCAAAAFMSLAAYFVSQRKTLIARVGFFVFYILDIIGIFGSEWMIHTLETDPSSYYGIDSPVSKIVLSAAVLCCYWLMVTHILDEHDHRVHFVPVAMYCALSVLVVVAMPHGKERQWAYYSLRQVFLAFTQVYALARYRSSKDETYRSRVGRYRVPWIVMWALICAIFVEDSIVILLAPIPSTSNNLGMFLFLSQRNVSENVMMLYVARVCIGSAVRQLSLRAEQAPEARPRADGRDDLRSHIEEQLPAYASANRLSNREREVLSMVLEGQDNRGIAGRLYLSEGTVKTHVHNIMKKTGTGFRDELKRSFWSH